MGIRILDGDNNIIAPSTELAIISKLRTDIAGRRYMDIVNCWHPAHVRHQLFLGVVHPRSFLIRAPPQTAIHKRWIPTRYVCMWLSLVDKVLIMKLHSNFELVLEASPTL